MPIYNAYKNANIQTKIFILISAIYMIALIWTTVQSYARLSYSRSDGSPVVIEMPSHETK